MLLAFAALLGAFTAAAPATAAVVTITGTRANLNPILPPGSGRCAPTYFNTVVIAPDALSSTGTSNLGDFASTQSHCLVSAPPTALVDGIFSYDFGLGDTLFGTYTGMASASGTPGLFNTVENLIVTGGTGRFDGATGFIDNMGQLRFVMQGGQLLGDYSGTLQGTLNLAPVPEPQAWAMMIAGVGVAGGVARRRRQREFAAA